MYVGSRATQNGWANKPITVSKMSESAQIVPKVLSRGKTTTATTTTGNSSSSSSSRLGPVLLLLTATTT